MKKDIMEILRQVPLDSDDPIVRNIMDFCCGCSALAVCVAVEYGRILGKREERARRAARV